MLHHILCKFKDKSVLDKELPSIQSIFDGCLAIPGIHNVTLKRNIIDRENRYDLLILIEMEPSSLPLYDACPAHKEWKERYGEMLEKKAIFDCE